MYLHTYTWVRFWTLYKNNFTVLILLWNDFSHSIVLEKFKMLKCKSIICSFSLLYNISYANVPLFIISPLSICFDSGIVFNEKKILLNTLLHESFLNMFKNLFLGLDHHCVCSQQYVEATFVESPWLFMALSPSIHILDLMYHYPGKNYLLRSDWKLMNFRRIYIFIILSPPIQEQHNLSVETFLDAFENFHKLFHEFYIPDITLILLYTILFLL